MLTALAAIGWITARHVGIGTGIGGVLRTAAMLWLVAHHVGFTVRDGGLSACRCSGWCCCRAPLAMAGRWVVRAGAVTRLRHVGYAAVALALPYALLAGALAVASRTAVAAPSLLQAVVASFLLALVAGGLGAARGLAPWSRLASLMPARPRSIVMGMLGSAAILAAAGAVLAGASLALHLPEVRAATDALAPGVGGAALLLLAQLAYAPNAVIWAVAYTLGPGFAFGTGTVVSPTGSVLGAVPAFPMLAAIPSGPSRAVRPGCRSRCSPCRTWPASSPGSSRCGSRRRRCSRRLRSGGSPRGRQPVSWPAWERRSRAARSATAACPRSARPGSKWGWWGSWKSASRPRWPPPPRTGSSSAAPPPAGGPRGSAGKVFPQNRGVPGVAPPNQPGRYDETDDAAGHRIYLNPWASGDQDDEVPVGLVEEYGDEP